MDLLAAAGGLAHNVVVAQAATENTGLEINLFWVIVAAGNFLVFFGAAWLIFFRPINARLQERRDRIEEGLRDADEARKEREQAALDRNRLLLDARHEANDILQRAQKAAEDSRARDLETARAEIERLRVQAAEEIDAERQRALADVRAQIADLALQAASRVVGETMTGEREHRLVDQFLSETAGRGGAAN